MHETSLTSKMYDWVDEQAWGLGSLHHEASSQVMIRHRNRDERCRRWMLLSLHLTRAEFDKSFGIWCFVLIKVYSTTAVHDTEDNSFLAANRNSRNYYWPSFLYSLEIPVHPPLDITFSIVICTTFSLQQQYGLGFIQVATFMIKDSNAFRQDDEDEYGPGFVRNGNN